MLKTHSPRQAPGPAHLHLGHGSLGGRPLHVLHEAAALARRDLGVHDVPKAAEEDAQVILSDAGGEAANEEGGVVGVRVGGVRLRVGQRRAAAHTLCGS
jgi:hypothetical protein